MDYSVIIGSIRPDIASNVQRCINSIRDFAVDSPYSYEIIVVSPFPIPQQDKVVWILDNEMSGSIAAYNLGAKHAKGEYIATSPDDWLMPRFWWTAKEVLEKIPGKFKVASYFTSGIAGIPFPMTFCMPAEMVHSDLMEGNILNPAFFHQVADNDLGLMLHTNGYPLLSLGNINTHYNPIDEYDVEQKRKYINIDRVIFDLLWQDKIGNQMQRFKKLRWRSLIDHSEIINELAGIFAKNNKVKFSPNEYFSRLKNLRLSPEEIARQAIPIEKKLNEIFKSMLDDLVGKIIWD